MFENTPNVILQLVGRGRKSRIRVHVNRLKRYYRQGFSKGEVGGDNQELVTLEENLPPNMNHREVHVPSRNRRVEPLAETDDDRGQIYVEDVPYQLQVQVRPPEQPHGEQERPRRQVVLPRRLQDYELT